MLPSPRPEMNAEKISRGQLAGGARKRGAAGVRGDVRPFGPGPPRPRAGAYFAGMICSPSYRTMM
jgi:hypothetical protein